jgi:DNA-binding CsgD family transcriptional regulator
MERLCSELIAEIAWGTPRVEEFELGVLAVLSRHIGFEAGFFCDAAGISDVSVGLDGQVRSVARQRRERMLPELARLTRAAQRAGGVVVDSELFGQRLKQLVYYDTFMRPCRGRTTLLGILSCHGQARGNLILGRVRGSADFSSGERLALQQVLPTLGLSRDVYARASSNAAPALQLTPREREVAAHLRFGHTNEQIARALGTSPRTVRNQLSCIYQKLGVGSRAEVVAELLTPDPARRRL